MAEKYAVFGAAGALGAAIVRELTREGKSVRAVVRDAEGARRLLPSSADVVTGDAASSESVASACRDAAVVYHCVNVPYQKWTTVMPVITGNILSGARKAKAQMVFPGNVYGYGPFQKIPATEDHPLAATSKKGQLRNMMEHKLMESHQSGDVKVVIPRFPDYYGPNVTNRLMAPIFEAALKGKKASWLGKLDVPHSLVCIDDAARACVLLSTTENSYGQVWHVSGGGALTGRQFIEMVFRASGTTPKLGSMGLSLIKFAGLFSPEAREMIELMYEFEEPLVLDDSKFTKAFASFKYTPHEEAVRQTVEWFRGRQVR